jgi:hypothetical protein
MLDDDARPAIRTAPAVSVTDAIIGRNSGVNPTPSATAKSIDSNGSWCCASHMSKNEEYECDGRAQVQRTEASEAMLEFEWSRPRAQAASDVSETRARSGRGRDGVAVPLTTDVPRKTSEDSSAPATVALLSTGRDSPVSIACWTDKSRDSISHIAGNHNANRDFLPDPVALDRRCRRDRCTQTISGALRLIRFPKIDADADQNDGDDDRGICPLS